MIAVFYSFKGGVGRSMALANVADLLARRGLKVLMVDFDMEAPGLEQYFPINQSEARSHPGLLDLLLRYKQSVSLAADADGTSFRQIENFILPVYKDLPAPAKLDLMPAGQREGTLTLSDYAQSLRTFDWQDFISHWAGDRFFEWLRTTVAKLYDVVLIDSRTGVTEMGGICAYQLADCILMFSGANVQNVEGTQNLVRNFSQSAVQLLRGYRPLEVVVVPARIEASDEKLLKAVRERFALAFDDFTPRVLEKAGLEFWDLRIPYEPSYAFEERVVTLPTSSNEERPIAHSFRQIVGCLSLLARDGSTLAQLRDQPAESRAAEATPLRYDPTRQLAAYDAFFLYDQHDTRVVEALAQQLERKFGLRIWTDRSFAPGANWSAQIEEALLNAEVVVVALSDAGVRGPLLKEVEFVFDASATRQSFRIIPVVLPQTESPSLPMPRRLQSYQALDLRRNPEESVEELANAIRGDKAIPAPTQAPAVDYGAPYIGLRAFTEDTAVYFAGRESALQSLIERVRTKPFTAVVGPAGSGKTSLVQGGLFPVLRAEGWRVEMKRCSDIISGDSEILPASDGQRTLLFLDDFEEVARDEKGGSIVEWLEPAKYGRDFVILVAIRDDAIPGLTAKYPQLASLISENQQLLLPMSEEELQQAIEQPARRAGYTFEPGLVNRMVKDFGGETRSLAVLQMVLVELYRQAREGRLTNEAYDRMGGLSRFLENHAEAEFNSLNQEEQQAAEWILLRLVETDASGETVLRRAEPVAGLPDGRFSPGTIERVVDKLMRAYLLRLSTRENVPMVELSSDVLLQHWTRLRTLIEANRTALFARTQLQTARNVSGGILRADLLERAQAALKNPGGRNVFSRYELGLVRRSRIQQLLRGAKGIGAAALALALAAWWAYSYTPRYQITEVIAQAPVGDAATGGNASEGGRDIGIHVVADWITTLRAAKKSGDAQRAFDLARSSIRRMDYGTDSKFAQATALAVLAGAADARQTEELLNEAESLLGQTEEPTLKASQPEAAVQQVAIDPREPSYEERTRRRQRAITNVAYGWTLFGQTERAMRLIEQVPASQMKFVLAEEITRRNNGEQNAEFLPKMTSQLEEIRDPRDRILAVRQWTRVLLQMKHEAEAREVLQHAAEDVARIGDLTTRGFASIALLTAYAEIDRTRAEVIFQECRRIAEQLPDLEKVRYLSTLAEGARGAVPDPLLTECWQSILELGTKLPPNSEVASLVELAKLQLTPANEPHKGEEKTEDVASARKEQDPLQRANALIRVARAQSRTGKSGEAKKTLDEALQTVGSMETSAVPSNVFAEIARGYSWLGDYRSSRLAANRCSSAIDKLGAYRTIVAKYFGLSDDTIRPVP